MDKKAKRNSSRSKKRAPSVRFYPLALLWQSFLCGFCEEHLTVRTSSWWGACEEVEDRLPDCRHARLRRRFRDSFFPSRCFEAAGLEEGVGDHCHQGMSM